MTLVSNLALRKFQIRDEGRLSTTSSKLQHFPFNLSLNAFQRLSLEREEPPGAPSCLVAEERKGSGDRSIGNIQRGKSEAVIKENRKHQTRKIITLNEGNQKTGLSATFWKSLERRATPCIIHIRDLRSDLILEYYVLHTDSSFSERQNRFLTGRYILRLSALVCSHCNNHHHHDYYLFYYYFD